MAKDNKVTPPSWNCGCGRSLHMPYCDGSHGRSEEQYEEWKRQKQRDDQESKITTKANKIVHQPFADRMDAALR